MTKRDSIDLEKGNIVVPAEHQKGKSSYSNDGKLVKKGYAKTKLFQLGGDDGLLTLIEQSCTDQGLKDERNISKSYKRDYKMPQSGYIFVGTTRSSKAKIAFDNGDQEGFKNALTKKPLTSGSVDAAITRVKAHMANQDAILLEEKKEEIDSAIQKYKNENPGFTLLSVNQKKAEIEGSIRLYDWAKHITSHSFRRSGCTQLSEQGYSARDIAGHYSGHSNLKSLDRYIGLVEKDSLRQYPGSVIAQSLKAPKRVVDTVDPMVSVKRARSSASTASTVSDLFNEYASDDDGH